MEKVSYHITCWAVLLVLQSVSCQQFVGDFCTVQSTGASGQCQIITDCPAAIQALQSQGVFPQICGFQGAESVVCCVGAAPVTKSTIAPTKATPKVTHAPVSLPTRPPPTTQTSITNKEPTILRVGDKSRAKCKEYVKHVYQSVVSGGPATADCVITDTPLIVGGERAKAKEFAHMALVGFDGENNDKAWQCGGSLISEQFVLTAGHCLFDKQYGAAKYIGIGYLILNSSTSEADPQDFNIIQTFKHPDYKPPAQYNDIALLKMDRRPRLSPYARPACLDTSSVVNKVRKPVASGWGKVGYSSDVSKALLKVTLEYFTHAECNYSYRNNIGMRLRNGIVDETQLCAGSHNESKDTCQGDSGGPLQVKNDEEFCMYKIVGVTSFGKACGVANIPGVYTRVSRYIEWIEGIVWP